MDSAACGTLGNVLPGSLLGPIVGLTFSSDGGLLFACSGSSLWVYDVRSGALLSTVRVFMPGMAVNGIDVGRESFGAIFGDKCVRVVGAVPTGADTTTAAAATSAWFQGVVHLPDLDDRVWDARLVDTQEGPRGGGTEFASSHSPTGDKERSEGGNQAPCQEGEREEDGRRRGRRAGMGLLAVALAHNLVEVWDWVSQARPLRLLRTRGGDPCLLYHARLWGRTLGELRVAAGTVFNQVLVWNPGQGGTTEPKGDSPGLEARGRGEGRAGMLPRRNSGVLRLKGHEGVIFRVAWREDGRRLVSASDDRTVRVWGVECNSGGGGGGRSEGEGKGNDGGVCGGQLLWTGWGHASRVWDVGFTRLGVVTCGEDGAAILWRKTQPVNETLAAAEAAAARTIPTTKEAAAAARTPLSVTAAKPQLHGRREAGQLVPVAIMRGHSGVNAWRLAVHEFPSRSGSSSSSSSDIFSRREERGNDRRGLTLMATGGNDGACKFWDLEFEGACERRQLWGKRRSGTLWGQTQAIPTDQHTTAGPVTPYAASTDDKSAAADTHEDGHPVSTATTTHPPLTASAATLAADRNEIRSNAAAREPQSNSRESEPHSNASSSRAPFQQQTSGSSRQDERGGQEQSEGRSSRRRGVRQRQKKPAVVREVKLAPPSNSGTAVAAALLLADGCVWWVSDLQVGTWERVTVAVGDAAVTDGVTKGGLLSSTGVSAVAVVGVVPAEQNRADKGNTTASDHGGKKDSGGRGSGGEVAIVAGRDDGWLFLLSQSQPPPLVDADEVRGDQPSSQPRAWRVSAAWKGHRSRVTALWAVSDAAQSRCPRAPAGGSQIFTAALETSRLSNSPSRGGRRGSRFDGALVSAGADGTVAWWEWACFGDGRNKVHGDNTGSGSEEMTMLVPRIRMVCRAGPGAAVTSVAIDDRRQPCNFGGEKIKDFTVAPDELGGDEDVPSAGAAVFCGDTKGSIQCFLEGPRSEGRIDGGRDEEVPGAGRVSEGLREALSPCLVLKRQHGKDQVSRIALRGNCLFSAGHDGQVNHYVVSYSVSSFGMLANSEPRRHSSAASPGRHASGEYAALSCSETVDLTIVTTYATAPVTTVSELWVSGDWNWEAGPKKLAAGGSKGQVRVAVAGRSGSSRMSVWDLTESRQILELECGEKHLAQDLVLSWPSVDHAFGCSLFALGQEKDPSTVTTSKIVDGSTRGKDYSHIAVGPSSCPDPPAAPFSCGRAAPPLLVLPRHAFVFAEPFSSAEGASETNHITAGKEAIMRAAGNNGPPAVPVGEVRERRQQHGQEQRHARPGVALAFHSSFFFPLMRGGDQPGTPVRQERPCESRAQPAAENVADSPAAGLGSAGVLASTIAVPANKPTAAAEKEEEMNVAAVKGDRKRLPYHPEEVRCGRSMTSDDGGGAGPVSQLPGRFGYSLGKPFHSQRVASAKFIIPGAPTARLEAGRGVGFPPDLRLITGGEDGAVKLLDVFYNCHRRGRGSQAAIDPATETFHRPYAKVVQTLPSHESSVGALAIGMYGRGSSDAHADAHEIGCFKGLESALVVSGGGKMEARAWCMAGVGGHSGSDAGEPREEAVEAACEQPPVRWLATATPAPNSPLHAHRIMCLCIPPPPTSQPRLPSAHNNCGGTIFVAGDSGGGITVFELQHGAAGAAGGSASVDGTAAAPAAGGGGKREDRSQPAGRWMTSGERPVLSLAHARVPSSAAPDTAVDFIATGDTGGTVTVWEFLPGGGSGVLAPMAGANLRQGASDVRGGFVHRGPAGKRRGGNGMSAEGEEAGEPPPCPGLVPVLAYRAHQMGVLCMSVHVPPEGGRMVVVTGGDDQAVCVAEVELRDNSMQPFDQDSPQGQETSCSDEETSAGERRFAVTLVGGRPELTNGAAGSAIKGISVVPASSPISVGYLPSAETHMSPGVEKHPAAGDRTRRSSIALSVFTISRDQRLSRWDLVDENKSLLTSISDTCTAVRGADGRHSSGKFSRTRADGADRSSSRGLENGADRGRRCSDVVGAACGHVQTALPHRDSHGLRQKTRPASNEEHRRWRLRWRAGCITDVADVSGLDVYPLPGGDPKQHSVSEADALCAQGASTREGAINEEDCGRNATNEADVSPAALVAVSGQGLQLVLFGVC